MIVLSARPGSVHLDINGNKQHIIAKTKRFQDIEVN